jgi:hypothetical protein
LPNIIGVHQLEKEEKERHVACKEEKKMYTFLLGKFEENRPHGIPGSGESTAGY